MKGSRIGFAITGSYCTFEDVVPQMQRLRAMGAEVVPIMSERAYATDTKFGTAKMWREKILEATGAQAIIASIVDAEPIGPRKIPLDLIIVAPCTGNTTAKLANAVTDSAVAMAVKAHLRNSLPVLIAVSTNDGLGLNAANIGRLLASRNVYFVPFSQDSPIGKPTSIVAHMGLIPEAAEMALQGKQIQPLLLFKG